ncbi:class I SAM-dependent methyltransferase [Lacihabitans sp. CCS-44]|uniref:class I SAM-dependent methyltransferase n=1 Tax=Lacihabitans sp. CCS-44 TaxID=2487331 RepID=UPI0020CBA1F9|nr:class I SAM-dependent methyltransferase [Lacihabitans sp. CCS-44]MCP9754553.1 class I SAM-dependent methyltransferase [Lacihabitans sp. CCS-44]
MKEFWNERYSEKEYVYGERPNEYLKEQLLKLSPGKILLPCEGEGRNAIFAALSHWKTFACDFSESGKAKAESLAAKNGVSFQYDVCDILEYQAPEESFDVIALIFAHFPENIRKTIHQKLLALVKPGGVIILEGFNKKQLGKSSGGPKSYEMLFEKEILIKDFEKCEIEELEEKTVFLSEGHFHDGEAELIRGVFRKKFQ